MKTKKSRYTRTFLLYIYRYSSKNASTFLKYLVYLKEETKKKIYFC